MIKITMRIIVLVLVMLVTSIEGYTQNDNEPSPTWEILYGPKVIYQGDTSKVQEVGLAIDQSKDLALIVKIHYTEQRKTDSKLFLSFKDFDGLLEGEFNDTASTVEFSFSTKWILRFAQMSGSGEIFAADVKCRDNRSFKETATLCTLMVKRK